MEKIGIIDLPPTEKVTLYYATEILQAFFLGILF